MRLLRLGQISDGDFHENATVRIIKRADSNVQEYATTGPLIEATNTTSASASASASEACVMEFREASLVADESATHAQIAVVRSGDTSLVCSVICSTQTSGSASADDFEERPTVESSRIFFLRGVTSSNCLVRIVDDSVYEGDEHFAVRLSQPQVEYGLSADSGNKNSTRAAAAAVLGYVKEVDVRIGDDEDVTRVQFAQSSYGGGGAAPGSDCDHQNCVVVRLVRTGDLTSHSTVVVATRDGSARAESDYTAVSRTVDFLAGDSDASVQLSFTPTKLGWAKSFSIVIDPAAAAAATAAGATINAQLGPVNVATIVIPPAVSTGPPVLPSEPIVVSLMHYGARNSVEQKIKIGT